MGWKYRRQTGALPMTLISAGSRVRNHRKLRKLRELSEALVETGYRTSGYRPRVGETYAGRPARWEKVFPTPRHSSSHQTFNDC